MRKELQDRLTKFAGDIIRVKSSIKRNYEGDHLARQLVRSGTSAALNYGEALGTMTRSDFIHKLSIVLKELRETLVNLKIIESNNLCTNKELLIKVLDECDQLTRLFTKSLQTLRRKT